MEVGLVEQEKQQKPHLLITQACLPGKVPNRYLQGQKSGFAMKNRYKSFKA